MGKKRKSQKAKKDAELVQHITMLARTGASLKESAQALGMDTKELEVLFKRRPKILKAWRQSRLNLILGIRAALAKSASEGKLAAIEKLLAELLTEVAQQPVPAIDFEHLKTAELSIAIGRQRQTVDRWRVEHGLRRNSDKTYSLPGFFVWFENFCRAKCLTKSSEGGDPLRDIKAEQIGLQVARHRKELLNRQEVICGLVAWVQNIKSFCERSVDELSRLCCNQPREKIAEIARGFFRDLYIAAARSPSELCLPPAMEKDLIDFLQGLQPHNYK